MKAGFVDKGEHALRDSLVVQGIVDGIRERGLGDVGAELDVHDNGLLDLPFPVENADDGLGLQSVNENFIHATTQTPLQSPMAVSSQLARALMPNPLRMPAASRMQPASAIMAPLSVQNSVRGKYSSASESRTTVASRSRNRRFAPTPPATTKR